jgi:hypothetical protein
MIKPLTMFFIYDSGSPEPVPKLKQAKNLNRSAGTYKSHKSDVSKEKRNTGENLD